MVPDVRAQVRVQVRAWCHRESSALRRLRVERGCRRCVHIVGCPGASLQQGVVLTWCFVLTDDVVAVG